jgi:hypothetical protein
MLSRSLRRRAFNFTQIHLSALSTVNIGAPSSRALLSKRCSMLPLEGLAREKNDAAGAAVGDIQMLSSTRSRTTTCVLALAFCLSGLVGCARMTHLTRTVSLPETNPEAKSILIDAKQRAITHARVGTDLRLCAEPSPDALSAIAASSGLSLSKGDSLNLATNLALAEGAGSIGLRTQSIQLMRDAMYRICEGYLSGALDGPSYETLYRRFQSSMVAILAIEQLTGVVRAPPITLGGSAVAGNAEKAAELTQKTEAALQLLRAAEAAEKTKQAALTEATKAKTGLEAEKEILDKKKSDGEITPEETARLDTLDTEITKAKEVVAGAQKDATDSETAKNNQEASYKSLDAARKIALAGGGNAGVTVNVIGDGAQQNADITKVASAVQEIVINTLQLQFGPELCTTMLLRAPTTETGQMYAKCIEYLNQTVVALTERTAARRQLYPSIIKLVDATAQSIAADPTPSTEKLKAGKELLEKINELDAENPPWMTR